MFKQLKENFLNMVNIRLIVLSIIALALGAVMIYRVFDLQIVKGEGYLKPVPEGIFMTGMEIFWLIMNWLIM